ncbi:M1 family aminopeptidase [Flavobacterium filum]|uniref:M1 family aminopeptidase n=1 Tax=Flavobacterium filum TaxID=370974 RepID=UPI0023F09C64|nr:M1 family aminopeptidase [Flavobacterium filum]
MFLQIFKYELKYWLKNPSVYIYGLIAFIFGLLAMAGNAGVFGITSSDSIRFANSPIALYNLISLFTKLALFIIPSVVGNAVYRDFKSNAHHILFSYPINKSEYLLGKFLSSFFVVVVIAILFLVGCFSGTMLPGADKDLITISRLSIYAGLLIVYLLPNLLLFSTITFTIVLFSRSIYVGFITTVIIIILRELLLRLTAGADVHIASLLLEPFGDIATDSYTITWSIEQQNINEIPKEEIILLNRLLWLLISCLVFFFCYIKFSFFQNSTILNIKKRKNADKPLLKAGGIIKVDLSGVLHNHSFIGNIKQAWLLSIREYSGIIKTGAFISIVLAGSLFVYVLLSQMNAPYGVKVLPATWVMLAFPVLFFSLLINFVTFLYAGLLVQRPRMHRMMQLIDTTAIKNWTLALSKFFALVKIQATLLSIILCMGILVQITNGYYRIELGHYLFDLFVIHLIGFVIWGFAALFIQTIFTNSWLGLFLLILIFFGISEIQLLGIENYIFRFNQNPDAGFYLQYSDLSGYSHSLQPYFIYKAYWFCFGLFLFCLCLLFWQRGAAESLKNRLSTAIERFKQKLLIPASSILFIVISTGFWIHNKETNSLKPLTQSQKASVYKEADKKYQKYQSMIQPRIIAVDVKMDIYPEQQNFNSSGNYTLVNKSTTEIDTLLVSTSLDVITDFTISHPSSIVLSDKSAGFTMLRLYNPLKAGDTLTLSYTVKNISNTSFYENSLVKKNGTYITSLIYPSIGYRPNTFTANPEDSIALQNHYRSSDADYIDFKANVSTTDEQIALAPGYLKKHWVKNGRAYYEYQSRSPVTNDYAFVSGKYIITKDRWKDIEIAIYHHKEHAANISHMIKGIKATLDYCETNYSQYQHKQIKIIEYSRSSGDYAQSFANTIPYSEIGFIMDIDKKGERGLNFPFLGASHELAHQWWGMQVIPADVNGAKMITESMAEFVSLKVLEKEYGKAKALEFISKSLNTYSVKSNEDETKELPLIYNTGSDKAYIPYQKGMLALNAISHYLGEEKLNAALKKYLNQVYRQKAPYTNSLEMVDYVRKDTPDSLKYLISDLFETVTFYDNKILNAKITKLNSNLFEVELSYEIKKYQSENSKKIDLPLNDIVEIGVYSMNSAKLPTEVKRIRVKKSKNFLKFIIGFKPTKILIDPNILMIDKNSKDNGTQL